jgi:hypothetical protein
MDIVIGNCSKCKGDVVMPVAWLGTQPPRATCRAVKKKDLPIVEMK